MAISTENEARAKSESLAPIKRLWPYLRARPWHLLGAAVALVAATLLTLTFPIALRRVIDFGFASGDSTLIDTYFVALIVVVGGLAAAAAARFYLVTLIGERLVADLRQALFVHLLKMSPGFFVTMRTGEVISRLTADMAIIQGVIGSTVSMALRNTLLAAGAATMMLITNPKLTLLVVVIVPPVIVPLITLGRRLRRLARETQDRVAEASGLIGEVLQAVAVVQAFTAERDAARSGCQSVERAFEVSRQRIMVRAGLTALVIFLISVGVVGVVWVGATDVANGRTTPGELGQFVLYAIFAAGSAATLSEVWGALQLAAGAGERIFELLDAPQDIRAPVTPVVPVAAPKGEVRFNNVSFHYPTRPETAVLDNFSLHVRPGERVALVGPSGAGKSTVFQLLLRFYDPTVGTVTVDGVDLASMDPVRLRQYFALVPQDPTVFARSAAANIELGRLGANRAEVETAAQAADAHEFIADLPHGYDTWLGERGVMLSGGQNQRVAIARAILRDAPVLLLDEATSALDAESERAVQQAITRLSQNRTALVIAHRLATVKQADRIVVMDAGRVVAEGTHTELIAAGGLYARFAELQFGAEMAVNG